MAESICQSFQTVARRLLELGLGYLSLDRASSTLSTGERQRMQLARAVRNRTTGVLYVLDEPSIGLHPSNIVGLTRVMEDLVADGNSVLLVDHDTQILREADWILEMGPEAGANGGQVVAQGTVEELGRCPASQIGPFLTGEAQVLVRQRAAEKDMFQRGCHPPGYGGHPHGEAFGGGHPPGKAHGGDGGFRIGENHHGAGEPHPRAGGGHSRGEAAGPRAGGGRPRHPPGEAH